MFTGELKVGDRLIWRHGLPTAFTKCKVVEIQLNGHTSEDVIRLEGELGEDFYVAYPVVLNSCIRDTGFTSHNLGFMLAMCQKQKTAAQQSQAAAENPDREPTGQD